MIDNVPYIPLDMNLCCDGLTRQAAHRGMVSICELVVENGVDVGAKSDDGITALIAAASEGHAEIVELLLGKTETDPDAKDKVCRESRFLISLAFTFHGRRWMDMDNNIACCLTTNP